MKISCIQMNSDNDIRANLKKAEELIIAAKESDNADLICLPEYFSFITANPDEMKPAATELASGLLVDFLSGLSRKLNVTIHAGSSLEDDGGNIYNATSVYDGNGDRIAYYRKMHLFDTILPDGTEVFESEIVTRGEEIATYTLNGVTIGCSICFDSRFPELYAELVNRGAEVILIPSAYTFATGSDHWEILLRARAIETQCYAVAPAQVLSFGEGKYTSWGHSMIIDPWGVIVAQASNQEGYFTANIDIEYLKKVRQRMLMENTRFLTNGGGR